MHVEFRLFRYRYFVALTRHFAAADAYSLEHPAVHNELHLGPWWHLPLVLWSIVKHELRGDQRKPSPSDWLYLLCPTAQAVNVVGCAKDGTVLVYVPTSKSGFAVFGINQESNGRTTDDSST